MNNLEAQIYDLVKRRLHDKAEGLWLELVEQPEHNLEFYQKLTHLLAKSKNKRRLNDWGGLLMTNLTNQKKYPQAMKIGGLFAKGIDGPCDFLPQLLDCIRQLNARRENLELCIELSGLELNENTAEALGRLDLMFYNDVGEVFAHESYGIGKIIDCDPRKQQVLIEYESGEAREYSFQGTREYLRKFPAGHFHALRLRNPEKLKKMAGDKPAEFMKLLLKSFNRELKVDDLKNLATEKFFTPAEWRNWWKDARDALQHDPYIELSGGVRGVFKLRETPRDYVDALCGRFRLAESAAERQDCIQQARKQFDPPRLARFIAQAEAVLTAEFGQAQQPLARRIECACLWQDLHDALAAQIPGWDARQALSVPAELLQALPQIDALDYQCRALELFAEFAPTEAAAFYTEALLKATPRLGAWIIKQLEDRGEIDRLGHAVERLISRPLENPELCVWGLKQYFDGKWQRFYHSEIAHVHVADLLGALEKLHGQIEHAVDAAPLRASFNKIKNFLWDKHCAVLRLVIEPLATADAQEFMQRIRKNPGLSSDYIAEATGAIRKVRDDLDQKKSPLGGDGAQATIYVTEHTLRTRHAELQRILSVEIPKNSREIGDAAALGDLRENAEYHAAKEYQKILHRRKEDLTNLISHARVIDLQNVRTDQITIGSHFRALNVGTNAEENFTILGFWDARPEQGILNYMSPLAQQFLEKRVGDDVDIKLPGGGQSNYKILEIARAAVSQAAEPLPPGGGQESA